MHVPEREQDMYVYQSVWSKTKHELRCEEELELDRPECKPSFDYLVLWP